MDTVNASELAKVWSDAAYLVSQTITNREWLLAHGEDYDAILAARKQARDDALAAYIAAKK
jgi:hypothetical protein